MKRLRMPVIVTCWLILCNIFNIVYLYTEQIQQGSYMGGAYIFMVEMGMSLIIAVIFGNLDLKRQRKVLWIKVADAQDASTKEKN